MSASGGFWPGEAPSAAEQDDVQEPEETAVESAVPMAWPQPHEEEPKVDAEPEVEPEVEQASVAEPEPEEEAVEEPEVLPIGHLPGELDIPDGVAVLEGSPSGADRTVGIVVSRFNGEISNRLLESALAALASAGVPEERITVMPVPGAFELPIGAMALAKTRRYSCVIALGCVVRGETAHFEYVAGEAASGLQLAGLETGVPVAFGVLTCDTEEQALDRAGGKAGNKGADCVQAALAMVSLRQQLAGG
ncbi:MAG: 6,7-dimethyl-8-ribityllumazine synthase [Gaiellaceae bacterium]